MGCSSMQFSQVLLYFQWGGGLYTKSCVTLLQLFCFQLNKTMEGYNWRKVQTNGEEMLNSFPVHSFSAHHQSQPAVSTLLGKRYRSSYLFPPKGEIQPCKRRFCAAQQLKWNSVKQILSICPLLKTAQAVSTPNWKTV